MKKNLFYLIILFGATNLSAQKNFPIEFEIPKKLEKKLIPIHEKPKILGVKEERVTKEQLLQLNQDSKYFKTIEYRNAKKSDAEKLDSVITVLPNGNKYSKQVFTYNSDNVYTNAKNYFWIAGTSTWNLAQEYIFEYDNRGNIVSKVEKEYYDNESSGVKNELIYDEQNNLISTRTILLANNENYYIDRFDYEWENGNMISENYFQSIDGTDNWNNTFYASSTYDDLRRQTGVEQYLVDNNVKTGLNKVKYEYYNDSFDLRTLYEYYQWNNDKTWSVSQRVEHTYDNGFITEQKLLVWSPARNNFSGDQTHKTVFTYDDHWRKTSEIAYFLNQKDFTTYDKKISIISNYTAGENDTTIEKQISYNNIGGEDVIEGELEKHYNKANLLTYRKEFAISDTTRIPLYEEYYEYDDRNNQTSTKIFEFIGTTKHANFRADQVFDKDNNLMQYVAFTGVGSDNWDEIMKYDYLYDSGVRVSTLGYAKRDGQWFTNFGNSMKIDNKVLSNTLILPSNYPAPYKVLETQNHETDGGTGWLSMTTSFFYSPIETLSTTDVNKKAFKVYPNPTSDVLNIDVDQLNEVKVYDIVGRLVLTSNAKKINMSHLKPGVYIVNIDGVSKKVIKK